MKNKISIIIFISVLIITFMPVSFTFFDSEPTEKFLSLIEIQDNGSIKVKELIKMNGEYNGMDRTILARSLYNNTRSYTINDIEGNNDFVTSSNTPSCVHASFAHSSENCIR